MPTNIWQKSSFSPNAGNCVEVAADSAQIILLRESDDPTTILTTTPPHLGNLIRAVQAGWPDLPRAKATFPSHRAWSWFSISSRSS